MQPKYLAPLYDNWSPPTLLYRDEELSHIFRYTIGMPIPNNIWIEGDKGLGKSLTCKFFAQEVAVRGAGAVFYLQCGSSFTASLSEACEKLNVHVPYRELNPVGVLRMFVKLRPSERTYFLIIDDPERTRNIHAVDDFVRDTYNVFNNLGKTYAMILVSRLSLKKAEKTFEVLSADSRLHPTPIVFKPYSTPEITNILEQRLQYAFGNPDAYEKEALFTIAKHIWRIGSDIREALEILRHAVLDRAREKLTVEDAEQAVEWAKMNWWKEKMLALPPHWAFMVYIAAKIARPSERGVVETDVSELIENYKAEFKNPDSEAYGLEPLGKTSIYHALKKMSITEGFFTLEKVKRASQEILVMKFDEGEARRIREAGEKTDWVRLH